MTSSGKPLTEQICSEHTRNEVACIDCCDSLETDGEGRRSCRYACKQHDFNQNSKFVYIESISILGADGDYTTCTAKGVQAECKYCCDESSELESGDRKYCRQACDLLPENRDREMNVPVVNLETLPGEYEFTEGPAVDSQGNLFFSDIPVGRIYRWSPDGHITVFLEGLERPNGLAFTSDGHLVACESGAGRLITINAQGQITTLADQFNGKPFNEPNDLWIDPHGGIYFTDPAYQSPVVQDGEHVYYLPPGENRGMQVIEDLIRPNGIVGTPDGKTLFVGDQGAGKTYAYDINPDGTLANKRLFATVGMDGMTIDKMGLLYLTGSKAVLVFDYAGNLVGKIPLPKQPSNVAFGGADGQTLFITARGSVYMISTGVPPLSNNSPIPISVRNRTVREQ